MKNARIRRILPSKKPVLAAWDFLAQALRQKLYILALMALVMVCWGVPVRAENLALNKTVTPHTNTAPFIGGAVYDPDYVVDGDDATVWYSYQGGVSEVSFTLDLGAAEEIGRYRFLPLQLTYIKIETSPDNLVWVVRFEESNIAFPGNGERLITEATPYQARYIRYTSRNSNNAYVGVAEFEVYAPDPVVSFAEGDGSVADPFQIATPEQLDAVRNQLDAHYILVDDIDLDVAPYNDGSGWEPIGVFIGYDDPGNAPFTGSLDGDGHEITHLYIDRPAENHAGLFGWASGARFSNLRLQVTITGNSFVGGLVGNIEPGSISNVHSVGSVVATANTAGGLAGRIRETEIADSSADVEVAGGSALYGGGTDIGGLVGNVQNDSSIVSCFATGSVRGISHRIGGLVGTLFSSSMTDSYATGDALGRESVGGLAGEHSGNSTIDRCYATGAVSATDNGNTFFGGLVGNSNASIADAFATGRVDGVGSCGGLVGLNNTSASIARSYSVGQVIGTGESVGGLVGGNSGSVETSYYNSETSGQADLGKGIAATSAEMRQQSTFIDWTFPAVWKIAEGHTYPYLSWQSFSTLAPTLLSPADQETLEGLSPTLTWLPAPNPDGGEIVRYQIQVATNSGFSGAVEYWVSAAGEVIPASLGFAALLLSGGTLISGRRRVAVLIAGVALIALLINGCGGSSSSSSSDRDSVAEIETDALTLTLQALDDNTTYYWRVRALDDQDQWSEWSQEWSFTTAGIL